MIQELLLVLVIMLSVAFFSLMERKVLSYLHYRKGPNKVLIKGFFQPFADVIKLFSKDDYPVMWSNKLIYYLSPMYMFFLAILCWMVYPFVWGVVMNTMSFITIIIILGMSVYSLMFSGWSSNSTYSMLGSMRSISQSISYEVVISFIFLSVIYTISSFSIEGYYKWKLMKLFMLNPIVLMITLISLLAEMNRSPFDLAEGESELVSGFSVEYGGVCYTLIFLGENMMIFFSSFMISFFFFSLLKNYITFFLYSFITLMICVIRGILPRIRYDKLMKLCWMSILPMMLMCFNLFILLTNL
uniref:NADH dehydrogenase subunit 1 n=1 Tax=Ciconiphilus decimfasciatus TaxID=2212705 RepID=UPI00257FB3CE|nr:NADH dehydrogenase subunit 1 [Ciconiphilus decimfasciatus]WGW14988.1 NADH dehydrogenase subunit 1 [Ciconiphilus decimfasciatus]